VWGNAVILAIIVFYLIFCFIVDIRSIGNKDNDTSEKYEDDPYHDYYNNRR
jgi:hypothetical protein